MIILLKNVMFNKTFLFDTGSKRNVSCVWIFWKKSFNYYYYNNIL